MDSISDKIRTIIEAKNLNKTKFCEQIGVARDYVYKLSDDTMKVSTLIKICDVLEIHIADFFIQKDEKNSQTIEEPTEHYGNKHLEVIKALKKTIKTQESTISAQEITIGLLSKQEGPKLEFTKATQKKENEKVKK